MTIAELHDRSRAFQARIQRRNLIEYAACVFVVAGFAFEIIDREGWMVRGGGGLMIAATLFIAWQLHRRASAVSGPQGAESLTDFYRAQLIRQRDAVRSIAVWYIAPFVPGFSLLLIGAWFERNSNHLAILFTAGLATAVFVALWLRNQRAARHLQRQVDALG